jgi:NADPH-dependent 2,4-dienoyl-CoA reductase/sulfur reductase-like enzyme
LKLMIVGGSDAGISAALRARELDRTAEITVLLADDFPNYSICGLPFFLSGETPDWHDLAYRKEFEGIEILRGHRAHTIDLSSKSVDVETDRHHIGVPFDRLILATGASPIVARIEGWSHPKSAVIVGAGYIGVEMADAFTHRGINVTLMGRSPVVFPSVDPEIGHVIDRELSRNGVEVVNRLISRRSGTKARASESKPKTDLPGRPILCCWLWASIQTQTLPKRRASRSDHAAPSS